MNETEEQIELFDTILQYLDGSINLSEKQKANLPHRSNWTEQYFADELGLTNEMAEFAFYKVLEIGNDLGILQAYKYPYGQWILRSINKIECSNFRKAGGFKKHFNKEKNMDNATFSKASSCSVDCLMCKQKTNHVIIQESKFDGKEWSESEMCDYYWEDIYQIIKCNGCGEVSFRKLHRDSFSWDDDGECIYEDIYPKREIDFWGKKESYNFPPQLGRIYQETIDCYNNNNNILCGAGVRALVEGLCKKNGVVDGNVEKIKNDSTIQFKREKSLQGKINGLHEKDILTKEQANNLHEIRFLGNDAIHDLTEPTKDELKLALEIIETVFYTLYELPKKAQQLKINRLKRK